MTAFFQFLGTLVSVYCLACFVRLILTWFPGAAFSAPARVLSRICDPYLGFFRRFRFLRTSQLDFSPALALAVLAGASSIFSRLAANQRVSVGFVLAFILQTVWSVAATILLFALIIIAIRLVGILAAPRSRSEFWLALDRILFSILRPVSSLFGAQRSWTRQLVAGGVFLLLVDIIGGALISILTRLLASLPF